MIVYNKFIPFKGFQAINLFGFIFTRKKVLKPNTINHENIHTAQMKETLYIFFYLLYCIEYLIRFITYLIKKQDLYDAYKNISFEQEAYQNEYRLTYLENRKHFSWIKYIKK